MITVITKSAEVTKWTALGLTVTAFVLMLAALLTQFDETLQVLCLIGGLTSGGLAVVVTGFAILTNILAWAARHLPVAGTPALTTPLLDQGRLR